MCHSILAMQRGQRSQSFTNKIQLNVSDHSHKPMGLKVLELPILTSYFKFAVSEIIYRDFWSTTCELYEGAESP